MNRVRCPATVNASRSTLTQSSLLSLLGLLSASHRHLSAALKALSSDEGHEKLMRTRSMRS
eukprot:363347-Chlamydomonas_euryale.AAC.7